MRWGSGGVREEQKRKPERQKLPWGSKDHEQVVMRACLPDATEAAQAGTIMGNYLGYIAGKKQNNLEG